MASSNKWSPPVGRDEAQKSSLTFYVRTVLLIIVRNLTRADIHVWLCCGVVAALDSVTRARMMVTSGEVPATHTKRDDKV